MSYGSIRSAEADRIASCTFADKVARCSLDFYGRHCPAELRASYKQTVVATILVRTEDTSGIVTLQVVSMGVGTKVLPYADVVEQRRRAAGSVLIRDCHAEVLARRGFLRFLYDQLSLYNSTASDGSSDVPACIFETAGSGVSSRLKLKTGVTLHLYTSSQPCGNASIKRWAKCKQLRFSSSLSEYEYPSDPHVRIQITEAGRKEGQVAVLVKRNNHAVGVDAPAQPAPDTPLAGLPSSLLPDPALAAPYIPAGTALAGSQLGNVATCSDKIARWNALGLQGSLLTALIQPVYLCTITVGRKFSKAHCERALCCRLQDFSYPPQDRRTGARKRPALGDPAAVSSIDTPAANPAVSVIGAIPAQSNVSASVEHPTGVSSTSSDGLSFRSVRGISSGAECDGDGMYHVRHPVMLSTSVKLDDGCIITGADPCTTALLAAGVGPAAFGANFDEPRCVCCYLTSAADATNESVRHDQCVLEVIDGRTGLPVAAAEGAVYGQEAAPRTRVGAAEVEVVGGPGVASGAMAVSSVCSGELRKAFVRLIMEGGVVHARAGAGAGDSDACAADRGGHYSDWKRDMSDPRHTQAKDHLFSEPTLFAQWVMK
jgi:double-stranded RNA-specific adenosine deaminase